MREIHLRDLRPSPWQWLALLPVVAIGLVGVLLAIVLGIVGLLLAAVIGAIALVVRPGLRHRASTLIRIARAVRDRARRRRPFEPEPDRPFVDYQD